MSLSVISVPESVMHCGNEMSCTLHTSLSLSTPNLKIRCYLQVEIVYASGTYVQVTSQLLDPDTDGNCRFFWNRYLWDTFLNNFDLPTHGSNTEFQLQHHIKRYNLWAVELSGDPQATTDTMTTGSLTTTRFAVRGTIPKARFAHLPFFGASGWNLSGGTFGLNKAFLDWRGTSPRTTLTEDQWLYFIWQDPGGVLGNIPIDWKVKWYRSDGTTGESVFLTTANQTPNEVYGYPAGFAQLDLATNETGTDKIYKYETWCEVTILAVPYQLSEKKTWRVDRTYHEYVPQLNYLNSLGVVAQFTLKGGIIRSTEIEKLESARHYEYAHGQYEGESIVHDVLASTGIVAHTGPTTIHEARQVAEIKASRKLWLRLQGLRQENIPVKVNTKKHEFDFLNNINGYEFSITIDYQDTVPDQF